MIHPDDFYATSDHPSERQQRAMWSRIKAAVYPPTKFFFLSDRRSFFYGMAASFVLVFTSVGVYTTVKSTIEYSQPQAIKLDRAYQSAIREFEKIAVQTVNGNQNETSKDLNLTRKEQLQLLDGAIAELKRETNSNDLSTLMRSRLRQLYSLKLKVLQEMVEQGEIEL